jgi:hypothetical protein
LASGKELAKLDQKYWLTYCAAFTPDGKAVVTGGEAKGGKGVAHVRPIGK